MKLLPTVILDTKRAGRGGLTHGRALANLARRVLPSLVEGKVELSLCLVQDKHIRALKREWFGEDRATDVLSFPLGDMDPSGVRHLGDIVISLETARREASKHGESVRGELALYLVHGLLHLVGYDHDTPTTRRAMGRRERYLLGMQGLILRTERQRASQVFDT